MKKVIAGEYNGFPVKSVENGILGVVTYKDIYHHEFIVVYPYYHTVSFGELKSKSIYFVCRHVIGEVDSHRGIYSVFNK